MHAGDFQSRLVLVLVLVLVLLLCGYYVFLGKTSVDCCTKCCNVTLHQNQRNQRGINMMVIGKS